MLTALKLSASVYSILLFLYPEELRQDFGDEMVDVFEQQLWGEWMESGVAGMIRAWARVLWELLWVALPIQLCAPIVVAPTVGLLSSSASFAVLLGTLGHHPVAHIFIAQGR
jgi:hypothetical protein